MPRPLRDNGYHHGTVVRRVTRLSVQTTPTRPVPPRCPSTGTGPSAPGSGARWCWALTRIGGVSLSTHPSPSSNEALPVSPPFSGRNERWEAARPGAAPGPLDRPLLQAADRRLVEITNAMNDATLRFSGHSIMECGYTPEPAGSLPALRHATHNRRPQNVKTDKGT